MWCTPVVIPIPFPSDLNTWPSVAPILEALRVKQSFERVKNQLTVLSNLLHGRDVFQNLMTYLQHTAHPSERERFLSNGLPVIATLSLECPLRRPEQCNYVLQQTEVILKLDKKFVAGVVATGFLCLWPENLPFGLAATMAVPNFTYFHNYLDLPSQQAKLRCILNYFQRLHMAEDKDLYGCLTIERAVLRAEEHLSFAKLFRCCKQMCPVTVNHNGRVEDSGCRTVQVYPMSTCLGGALFTNGAGLEEIPFLTSPELIAAVLFCQTVAPNEAILIRGFERFNMCRGTGECFTFAGDIRDPADRDNRGNFQTSMCAIDPISYRCGSPNAQFTPEHVIREFNKTFVAFRISPSCIKVDDTCTRPSNFFVSTGNWGCGPIGGYAQLKFLIQWMAASIADRPGMIFHTYGERSMADIDRVVRMVGPLMPVQQLAKLLAAYCQSLEMDFQAYGERRHELFDVILPSTAPGQECSKVTVPLEAKDAPKSEEKKGKSQASSRLSPLKPGAPQAEKPFALRVSPPERPCVLNNDLAFRRCTPGASVGNERSVELPCSPMKSTQEPCSPKKFTQEPCSPCMNSTKPPCMPSMNSCKPPCMPSTNPCKPPCMPSTNPCKPPCMPSTNPFKPPPCMPSMNSTKVSCMPSTNPCKPPCMPSTNPFKPPSCMPSMNSTKVSCMTSMNPFKAPGIPSTNFKQDTCVPMKPWPKSCGPSNARQVPTCPVKPCFSMKQQVCPPACPASDRLPFKQLNKLGCDGGASVSVPAMASRTTNNTPQYDRDPCGLYTQTNNCSNSTVLNHFESPTNRRQTSDTAMESSTFRKPSPERNSGPESISGEKLQYKQQIASSMACDIGQGRRLPFKQLRQMQPTEDKINECRPSDMDHSPKYLNSSSRNLPFKQLKQTQAPNKMESTNPRHG